MSASCPRPGCTNLISADQAVCTGDFHALAGMCRGKKRLGQPVADAIEIERGKPAYFCQLCRSHHNGGSVVDRLLMQTFGHEVVTALRDHPRIGWRGVLQLADSWAGDPRARWHEGLDQQAAMPVP